MQKYPPNSSFSDCLAYNLMIVLALHLVMGVFVSSSSSSHFMLCRLQGKSQMVGDELVQLGEQLVQSAEGTRAVALELCREFEDRFLQHITTGEVRHFFCYGLCLCIFLFFYL